jgi:hypothetical protein
MRTEPEYDICFDCDEIERGFRYTNPEDGEAVFLCLVCLETEKEEAALFSESGFFLVNPEIEVLNHI